MRFRPNLVVDGAACPAFSEDEWKSVRIGRNNFQVRCVEMSCHNGSVFLVVQQSCFKKDKPCASAFLHQAPRPRLRGCCVFFLHPWVKFAGKNFFPLQTEKLCSRCGMICIDQRTGEKGPEPLRTLTRLQGRKTTFGILLKHSADSLSTNCARLNVGDNVQVLHA